MDKHAQHARDTSKLTFSRQELYDRVWATPISRLAPEFGLSDVGLAKICKKHRIPRPPVGYWARLQHGKEVKRPSLPVVDDPTLETVTMDDGGRPRGSKDGSWVDREGNTRERTAVTVSEVLTNPHPLVLATKKSLRATKPSPSGRVRPRAAEALPVCVAPENVDRAMRILDALLKALDDHGCSVRAAGEGNGIKMLVEIEGELVPFYFAEITDRKQLVQPEPKYSWQKEYSYSPTGRLELEVSLRVHDGTRCRWADGKKQRIEKILGGFIDALFDFASFLRKRRRDQEERERRRLEWEQQRSEKLKQIREEEGRLKELLAAVDAWHQSQRVRTYVEDVVERVKAHRSEEEIPDRFWTWVEWAQKQADRIDPLIEGPPSILDEREKWERSYFI